MLLFPSANWRIVLYFFVFFSLKYIIVFKLRKFPIYIISYLQ